MNKKQDNGRFIWLLGMAILSLIYLFLAAHNLTNYYRVSGDDGWIMSASYKLSTQGIFGSDMYTGFFNADHDYFIALPVYHFLQAASFKLFGFGITQARLPNLFSGLLLIWLTSSIAHRHFGRKTALLTAILLLFLCPGLATAEPCVMLLVYTHTGRYDLTATTLAWLGVWQLDNLMRHPKFTNAIGLGIISGLATLTQFFGAFVIIPTAVIFLLRWGKQVVRQRTVYLYAAGFLFIISPYILYILAHLEDFLGQSILKSGRIDFGQPTFYLENILHEPKRFTTLFQSLATPLNGAISFQTIGLLLLFFMLVTTIIVISRLANEDKGKIWPTPFLTTSCFFFSLTLFDQTKVPIYTIIMLPGICLLIAAGTMHVFRLAKRLKRPLPIRIAITVPVVLLLIFLFQNGIQSHRKLIEVADQTTPYQAVVEQIKAHLTPGAVVLGSERWWPGLADYHYLSLNNIWAQWQRAEDNGRSPEFSRQVQAASVDFIIVGINVRGNLSIKPDRLQNQFRDYLAACGAILADWEDQTYARIQIYQLNDSANCQEGAQASLPAFWPAKKVTSPFCSSVLFESIMRIRH